MDFGREREGSFCASAIFRAIKMSVYTNLLLRITLLLLALLFILEEELIVVAELWKEICRFFALGRQPSSVRMSSKPGSNSGAVVSAKMRTNSRAALTKSTSLG